MLLPTAIPLLLWIVCPTGGPAIDFAIPLVLGCAPFIAFVAMNVRAFPPKPQKARLGWGTLGKRGNAQ